MTLFKHKSGSWLAPVHWPSGARTYRSFPTKDAALDWMVSQGHYSKEAAEAMRAIPDSGEGFRPARRRS